MIARIATFDSQTDSQIRAPERTICAHGTSAACDARALIVEQGPSYRLESTDEGVTLVATGAWSKAADHVLESRRADGLDLNYAKGFKDTDLAFIRDWPLRRLKILARTVKDLGPVERLSATLESLSVQSAPSATVNLAKFPSLVKLGAEWVQVRSAIADAPNLQDLYLGSYDEIDLAPLHWNSKLVRLRFKDRPRLQSLAGIDALRELQHLGVYLAPLHDIDALSELEPASLRELHIESCRVRDLSPIAGLEALRFLNVSDGGNVQSLIPIQQLDELSTLWLWGTTKVLDDDLSPLARLPRLRELRMRSRRTYRPSVEHVQGLIADRGAAV